jgi:hypothetical protein
MLLHKNSPGTANLSDLLEGLLKAGVDFIVVGGLAAVIQGVPVTTMDLDIVHRRTRDNIDKLMNFLKKIDAFYRRPDDKRIEPDEYLLSAKGHSLLSTRLGPLDILALIEKEYGYEELISNCVEVGFRGYTLRVLSLKAIIELKQDSKDLKDIARLPILKETARRNNSSR